MTHGTPARAGRYPIAGRGGARSRLALRRVVCLRLLHTCALALLLATTFAAGAGASVNAADQQWSWPLDGSPTIAHGFQPPPQPWLAGHRGVDLLAYPGEPVLAAGAGRVTFAGWVGGIPVVTVLHPDGRRTTYQPLLATVVRGDQVARGAILGRVSAGDSHCLPRACLHWGLLLGSSYLDPLSLVGRDIEVRLLPLWSLQPPSAQPKTAQPTTAQQAVTAATSPVRADLARLGALNRARAMGR
jgi:murein DD-endopeptidase MepM/ murein hydrolase activator NlpD